MWVAPSEGLASGDTWVGPAGADGAPARDVDGGSGRTPEPDPAHTSGSTGTAYGAELASYGRGSADSASSPNGTGDDPPAGATDRVEGDAVPDAPTLDDAGEGTATIPPAPALDPSATPAHLRAPGAGGPGGPDAPAAPVPPRTSPIRLPRIPGFRRRGEHDPARQRGRGLRVRQRLWNVDPWSVFKVSALFYLCLFFILLVAGTLLWNVGRSSGTIDQAESFVTRLGAYGSCVAEAEVPEGTDFENDDDCPDGEVLVDGFEVDDGTIFRAAAIGGVILVVTGSLGNVLMTVLLNLINEVTGGTRYTIIKEPAPRSPPGAGAPPDAPARSPGARVRR